MKKRTPTKSPVKPSRFQKLPKMTIGDFTDCYNGLSKASKQTLHEIILQHGGYIKDVGAFFEIALLKNSQTDELREMFFEVGKQFTFIFFQSTLT